jgi:hypothetical protein
MSRLRRVAWRRVIITLSRGRKGCFVRKSVRERRDFPTRVTIRCDEDVVDPQMTPTGRRCCGFAQCSRAETKSSNVTSADQEGGGGVSTVAEDVQHGLGLKKAESGRAIPVPAAS